MIAAVLSMRTATFAEPSTPPTTQNPELIVWAHTDLKNQGAPTLDILDLERYFAAQLAKRRIQNVAPSQTARQTRSPAQNEYLIELSVDAIQPSTRATQDYQTKVYTEDPVFYVELSLAVKHPASGRVQGTLVQRQDYHLAEAELERAEPKRNAIYKTADRLADEFVDAAGEGRFGAELKSIQAPLSTLVRPWHVFVGLGGLSLVLLIAIFVHQADVGDAEDQRRRALKLQQERDTKRLQDALALSLSTCNFDDEACWESAKEARERILERGAEIQEAEAKRRLKTNEREAEYERIAAYAAATSNLNKDAVIRMLRSADEWDYRVLRDAQIQDQWRRQ
ncbi:MAG: hypothetical protein ACHQIK_09895 [Candidatus Acidiferrales bacterium]